VIWFVALLAAITLLLFVPLSVKWRFVPRSGRPVAVEVSWGGLEIEVNHFRAEPAGNRESLPRSRRPSGGFPHFRQFRAAFLNREFLSWFSVLLRRLVTQLRPRDVDLELRAGLSDPFETGWLCALLAPVLTILWAEGVGGLVFVPEFSRPCFELEGSLRVRIIPALILSTLVFGIFSPPLWEAQARYRRAA
jgi:hypothetical protein